MDVDHQGSPKQPGAQGTLTICLPNRKLSGPNCIIWEKLSLCLAVSQLQFCSLSCCLLSTKARPTPQPGFAGRGRGWRSVRLKATVPLIGKAPLGGYGALLQQACTHPNKPTHTQILVKKKLFVDVLHIFFAHNHVYTRL